MLLTKDNVLRFIREKKAVIPTDIAENFETTTMIASAVLSELAKDNLIKITHLKLASSPYYYDPNQKEYLIQLGEKHFKGYDKEVFNLLREKKILPLNSLSIQHSLAIERIKDFAIPLTIVNNEKELKFYVWYLEDIDKIKKELIEYINGSTKKDLNVKKETTLKKDTEKEEINLKNFEKNKTNSIKSNNEIVNFRETEEVISNNNSNNDVNFQKTENNVNFNNEGFSDEKKVDLFLSTNNFIIKIKHKKEKGFVYEVDFITGLMKFNIDIFYFNKRFNEVDVINFYTSSLKPKIIIAKNIPKKLYKISNEINNLKFIDINDF
jgi:hypothetical protein